MPAEAKEKQIEKKDLSGDENIEYRDLSGGSNTEYVEINNLKNEIDLTYLKNYIAENVKSDSKKMDVVSAIGDKMVFYVPIEDGKWNVVKYQVMYFDKDNGSEIIKLPIMDVNWNILRFKEIIRDVPLKRPILDPIDFVTFWWWVFVSFLNWLKGAAPRVGINLSKTAIQEISAGRLFASVLLKEIPKDAAGNIVSQWIQD